MRSYLLAAMTTLVAAASTAQVNAETVMLRSGSYADFRQLVSREAATNEVSIAATLSFPDAAQDHYPAIVIVHCLGGYVESNEGWHAAEFRKAGFATLTYDSPTARSMRQGSSTDSRCGPPWASAVAEAYAALTLLAGDPRIDASRIAIVGFSFGGEVAHLAAIERLRAALVAGQNRFAAHVSYYPAGVYGVAAGPGAYTGAPILMLLGEKDENLPVAKAEEYLTYARKRGSRAAHRRLDLSGSGSRLDDSQPGRCALLSAVPQHAKMSVSPAGAIPARSPHQRPGSADGSQCLPDLPKERSGLRHGLR